MPLLLVSIRYAKNAMYFDCGPVPCLFAISAAVNKVFNQCIHVCLVRLDLLVNAAGAK